MNKPIAATTSANPIKPLTIEDLKKAKDMLESFPTKSIITGRGMFTAMRAIESKRFGISGIVTHIQS